MFHFTLIQPTKCFARYGIYTASVCIFILCQPVAAVWSQQTPGDLPDVGALLETACAHIESLEQDLGQAYLYRRAATLFGRSGDVKSAYEVLNRIKIPSSAYPQTADNLRRAGFLEMIDKIALHHDAKAALKVIDECPDPYCRYADDAFGRAAVIAAERGDAEVAWLAINRINRPEGLYPYELIAARALNDKTRGKAFLLEWHRDEIASIAGRRNMAREEWRWVLWKLSFYNWCGMETAL